MTGSHFLRIPASPQGPRPPASILEYAARKHPSPGQSLVCTTYLRFCEPHVLRSGCHWHIAPRELEEMSRKLQATAERSPAVQKVNTSETTGTAPLWCHKIPQGVGVKTHLTLESTCTLGDPSRDGKGRMVGLQKARLFFSREQPQTV